MELDQGFSTLALLTLWVGQFSVAGGWLVPSRMFGGISGLCPLHARVIVLLLTSKNVSRK